MTGAALYARSLGEDALEGVLDLAPADFQRDSVEYWLTLADVHRFRGRHELQHAFADSGRALLERKLAEEPDEPSFHSDLGSAYFLLGEEASALRETRRGVDLRPLSKDALSEAVWHLALLLSRLGHSEAAVTELEKLVSRPGPITVGLLRLHPELEPLRANARFRRLIEEDAA
jgi:tetratricopeptide (TPR) repeat protein